MLISNFCQQFKSAHKADVLKVLKAWSPKFIRSWSPLIAPNFVCQKCFGCYELPVHLLWCILIASQSFLAIVGISSSLQRIPMKIYVFRVSCFHLGTPRKSTCTWSCGWEKFPCTLHRHRRSTIFRTRPRGTRQKSSNVTFVLLRGHCYTLPHRWRSTARYIHNSLGGLQNVYIVN